MSDEKAGDTGMKSLVEKLAGVMALVGRVKKRGRNTGQGYDYATEADVAEEVRGLLSEAKLILIPSVKSVSWREITPKSGGITHIATVMMDFTFTDGEASLTYSMVGEGMDSGDKNVYKAMTGAEKYALMKFFLIPTGDDPEKDDEKAQTSTRKTYRDVAAAPPKATQSAQDAPGAAQDGKTADSLDDEIRAKARELAFRNGSNPDEEIEKASGFDLNGKWLKFSDPKGKSEKWRKSTLGRLLAGLAASEPGAEAAAAAMTGGEGVQEEPEWLR